MFYLIQGFFFQNMQWLDVSHKTGEAQAVICSSLVRNMFMGAVGPDPENEMRNIGVMDDLYGESQLTDVQITDSSLSFTKTYIKRGDPIYYEFKKNENGVFVGTWKGPAVGKGTARCWLTPVNESVFDPRELVGG